MTREEFAALVAEILASPWPGLHGRQEMLKFIVNAADAYAAAEVSRCHAAVTRRVQQAVTPATGLDLI